MAALPFDIITVILCKLPPKTLLRFKCVSKSWNSLISSPNFIKLHLSQTLISDTNPKIIVSYHSLYTAPLSAVNDTVLRFSAVDHPLSHLPRRPYRSAIDLIESCHGILFITDCAKISLFLLNPSTKTQRLLPPIPSKRPRPDGCNIGVRALGFGYDGCSDDYKVVRFFGWCTVSSVNAGYHYEVAVYSVRKSSWVLMDDGGILSSRESRCYIQETNAVFAKEMLHFVAMDNSFKWLIICFDLRTDTTSVVEYPEMEIYDARNMTTSFSELNECLCMLMSSAVMGDNGQFLYADVWEMRERGRRESWVKLFTIEIGQEFSYLKLVRYSKDKGSVLVYVDGTWLGWYDLTAKKMKRISVNGLRDEGSPLRSLMMVESLVSVASDNVRIAD